MNVIAHDIRGTNTAGRIGSIALAVGLALGAAGCDQRGQKPPAPAVTAAAADTTTPAPAMAPQAVPVPAPVAVAPQGQPVPPAVARTDGRPVPVAPNYAPPPAYPPVAQVQPQVAQQVPVPVAPPPVVARAPAPRVAEIVGIEPIRERPQGTGAGAVIGGVLGAVVGNQFGHGNGRAAMTVLGAGGGAVAGNNVERNINKQVVGYRVRVQLASGATQVFEESRLDGLRVGDRVRIEGGRLRRV